jgi:hypothetical protein
MCMTVSGNCATVQHSCESRRQPDGGLGGACLRAALRLRSALLLGPLTSPDEAYAAKAMPDLGLEIEDFQAQTSRIEHWSQQPKRLVGPEFSCGGHKWCVVALTLASIAFVSQARRGTDVLAGESFSFPRATPMASPMTWSLCTWIMRTQRPHQKAGTHAPSSASPSQTLRTLPSRLPAVSLTVSRIDSLLDQY